MARNKEYLDDDFDLDLDIDFDFPGDKPLPPPKNKREAVTRALADGLSGAKDELLINPVNEVEKIIDKGMPRALRSEYADITEIAGNIKDATENAIKDIKKEGQGLANTIAAYTPEGSKFRKLLDKLSGPQGEQLRGPSREATRDEQINQAILGALGSQQEQTNVQAAIRNAMEEKRAATTANLLQSIYAEVRMERSFHYKITNSYYRKSLEIQMKQLYTQKELLELTRANFSNFKTQLEYIVNNTGLPDVLKITKSEALSKDLAARGRQELINKLYSDFNPLKALGKNMTSSITNLKDNIVGGFQMGMTGIDMSQGLNGMEGLGMTKSNMAGMMMADWLKGAFYGKLGEKLAKTKVGKNFVFGAKNAMLDPNEFIKNMQGKKRSGKMGAAQDYFWDWMGNFTGASASKNSYTFKKQNLDGAQIFDGRAHQAIVKVIPGLLSKIHAELKTSRVGGKPSDHELAWDNKTDGFNTTAKMSKNLIRDIKSNFKGQASYYASSFSGMLQEYGQGQLSQEETQMLNRAVVEYLLNNHSSTAPSSIISKPFLNKIQDPKLRTKIGKMGARLLKEAKNDPRVLEDIQYNLSAIRRAMPNPSGYMEDLHKSGNIDAAIKSGLATRTGDGYKFNDDALQKIILDTVLGNGEEKKTQLDEYEKFKAGVKNTASKLFNTAKDETSKFTGTVITTGKNVASKLPYAPIAGAAMTGLASTAVAKGSKIREAIKHADRKSVLGLVMNKKATVEDLADPKSLVNMSASEISQANKYISTIAGLASKSFKTTENLIKNAGDSSVAGEIRKTHTQVEEKVGEFIEFVRTNGYNKQAFENYVKEVKASIGEGEEKRETSGIGTVAGVAFKVATGGTKEEWEQKTKEFYAKAAKGGLKILGDLSKERPLEELKAEYFKSPESKGPSAPTFEEWTVKMGYKVKGSTLKRIRSATLALDRKMAKFLLKLPFKLIKGAGSLLWKTKGLPFKALGMGTKLGGSIIGGAAGNAGKLVKEIFTSAEKSGGQAGVTAASQMTQATTALMTAEKIDTLVDTVTVKLGQDTGEKKKRKGSWMDRLNLFGKKEPKTKDISKNVRDLAQKGDKWMLIGLVTGIFGFVKKLFGGIGDVVGLITGLPGKLLEGLKGLLSSIPGLDKLLGGPKTPKTPKTPTIDRQGNKVSNKVSAANTKTSIPDNKSKEMMKGLKKWLPNWVYKKIEPAIQKLGNIAAKFKTFFSRLGRIASKSGGAIAKSIAKFLAKYVLASATGIGIFAAIGFSVFDTAWILKYWLVDDLSLGNAICKQTIGFTPFGEGENSEPDPFVEDNRGEGREDSRLEHPTPTSSSGGTSSTGGNSSGSKGLNSTTPINTAAAKTNAYTGASGKGSFPALTKVDNSKVNSSPYIKPNWQTDVGKPANILGLKPDFRRRLEGFAKDYYQYTGKKLEVTSGHRTFEDQKIMWEKEAKTKYTGNRKNDEAATAAAGGKFYDFRGGNVAYPNPRPTRPGHLTGEAVDLNMAAMPGGLGINDVKKTPWLDDMLEKWGLHRPLTAFKGHKGRRERWHVSVMKGAGAIPASDDPEPIDVGSLSGKDRAYIEKDAKEASAATDAVPSEPLTPAAGTSPSSTAIAGIGAASSFGGNNTPGTMSGGSPVNTTAMTTVATSTAATAALATPAVATTNMTVDRQQPAPSNNIDYTYYLSKQLEVQTSSMRYLEEIFYKVAALVNSKDLKNPTQESDFKGASPGSTDFPNMAVSLQRKTDYA